MLKSGIYYYSRPSWCGFPGRVTVRVSVSDTETVVWFSGSTYPTNLRDIPSDAIWELVYAI